MEDMELPTFPLTDPLGIFATLIFVVVIMPFLLKPLRIPVVVGLILGGVVIGPQVLGIVTDGEIPRLMGKIGIICLMFLAGLEIDLHELSRRWRETLGFGVLTFLVPLGMGIAGGMAFGMDFPRALLLASMFSSHTLLSYPEASRFGLSGNRAVTIAVGGTVITDLPSLLILAVVTAQVSGDVDAWHWVRLGALLAGYTVVMLVLLPFLARRGFKYLATQDDFQFLLAFGIVFLAASLATPAGLEPVIGAFLAGLALNRLIPESSILMNRLKFVGNTLFIPLFLVHVGLLVTLGDFLQNPASWAFAGFMVAAALVGKFIPAMVTALINRFTLAEGFLMYGLSVNQAAATLAIVLVARNLGLFGDEVLMGTILMILVTCVAGSWITEAASRKVSLAGEASSEGRTPRGVRIMLALSRPETAPALTEFASYLCTPGVTEAVYPATVVLDGPQSEADLARAESLLAASAARLTLHGVGAWPVTGLDLDAAGGLLRISRARRAQVMVLGWNASRTMGRTLFGSAMDRVISRSTQRILVVRPGAGIEGIKGLTLVLPPLSERLYDLQASLEHVADLARALDIPVHLTGPQEATSRAVALMKEGHKSLQVSESDPGPLQGTKEWLSSRVDEDEFLAVLSVRKHQLAWQPLLERLPRELAEAFPANRLMVLYPAVPGSSGENPGPGILAPGQDDGMTSLAMEAPGSPAFARQETDTASLPRESAPFPPARLSGMTATPSPRDGSSPPGDSATPEVPGMETSFLQLDARQGLGTGTRRLLACRFDAHEAQSVFRSLEQDGRLQPVELRPGVLLLHCHGDDTEGFWVGIGSYAPPMPCAEGENPVHTLCVLASPRDLGPEAHLQALSRLVRWVMNRS